MDSNIWKYVFVILLSAQMSGFTAVMLSKQSAFEFLWVFGFTFFGFVVLTLIYKKIK
tara:strand:+ start:2230 stop:2400 length:171 start_codon:yes stop_codon:yes gene_type:complete